MYNLVNTRHTAAFQPSPLCILEYVMINLLTLRLGL